MRPALLIIDAQNEYFAPDGQWIIPDGEQALTRIQALLAAARDAGLPVFHITHENLNPAGPVFTPGTAAVAIRQGIDVRPGEKRILKHYPGSFTQTALEAYLRQAGVDTVIVCGYMTHMCCDTTTRQARERGFSVLFTSDATATRDLTLNGKTIPHQIVHETTLAIMTQFAVVRTSAEIIQSIQEA